MKRHMVLLGVTVVAAAFAMAQQEQPKPARPETPTAQRTDPKQSDAKKGQEDPVAEHQNLEQFVGTWDVSGTCTAEGEGPKTITGTLTSEWALGKHFVKSHMKATEGGKSIEGIGFCGYDPAKGKYVSSWHTDQCNSIMLDEGTYEQGQKVFTYSNQMTGPDGKSIQCRRVVKVVSNNEHTMTIYMTEAGKGEQKTTEITFKRSGRTARADG